MHPEKKGKTDKLDIAILIYQHQMIKKRMQLFLLQFLTLYISRNFCRVLSSNIDQGLSIDGSVTDCQVECFKGVFG